MESVMIRNCGFSSRAAGTTKYEILIFFQMFSGIPHAKVFIKYLPVRASKRIVVFDRKSRTKTFNLLCDLLKRKLNMRSNKFRSDPIDF